MPSSVLEIVELANGDIVLQRADGEVDLREQEFSIEGISVGVIRR